MTFQKKLNLEERKKPSGGGGGRGVPEAEDGMALNQGTNTSLIR